MSNRKFLLTKEPFIRKADRSDFATAVFMRDYVIALMPLIIFAWIKNGILPFIDKVEGATFWTMIYPLLFVILGGLFSVILELGYYGLFLKEKDLSTRMKKSFAPIPGILLAMILTVNTPIWVLFIGVFFATVVGKLLFGGFGHNIFNPALVGYLFITTAYYGLISNYFNPSESIEIVSGATPLAEFGKTMANVGPLIEKYGLWKMFVGLVPGSLAETSALLSLIALVYLIVRKVTSWRIPVIYLGTVFVLTYIIGAFNGYANTLDFALFQLLSGGLVFGAVFMATEPVTSPRNPNGKIIYGFALGVLTVLFRFKGATPEGVATSILIMNMFTAIVERVSAKLRVESNKRKVALTYSLIGLLLLGISAYPVASFIPKEEVVEEGEIVFTSKTQNLESLNFEYTLTIDDVDLIVTTDQTYKIKTVSDSEYNTKDYKDQFSEIITKNKFTLYVVSADEGLDYLTVEVASKGYKGIILSTITFDENNTMTLFVTDTSNESYDEEYNEGWSEANGHPGAEIPGRIISNQDNLDNVTVISGATVTSNALINAAKYAKEYLNFASSNTSLRVVGLSQDYDTLDFVYIFREGATKFEVTTDQDYNITSTVDSNKLTAVQDAINNSKLNNYIESATDSSLVVVTRGYKGPIKTTITFDANYDITAVTTNVSDESYDEEYNTGWSAENGNPGVEIPTRIVENQDNLDNVQYISGATVTSKAIVAAGRIALDYLANLEGTNE